MKDFDRAAGVIVLAGAALLAGCSTTRDPDTHTQNAPEHTGIKNYGSKACNDAEIRVVRSSSLGHVYNATVINGIPYAGYTQAYNGWGHVYRQTGVMATTTLTSNTGESFTLMPLKSPEQVGRGFGTLGGLALGALVGGGTAQIAAAVVGSIAGYYGGSKVDSSVQSDWLNVATRCALDVESGAYNRPGGPRPEDKAQAHPLESWGPRIYPHLPSRGGQVIIVPPSR